MQILKILRSRILDQIRFYNQRITDDQYTDSGQASVQPRYSAPPNSQSIDY
ncbi:MAG: hypothetical protein VKK42_28500 [Lyngbya sp.]|nr:hypothetical protein [Lyngbya sp.]